MYDFIRVAAAVPNIVVGDTSCNLNSIKQKISEAIKKDTDFIVFPELSLTGSTCGDLFFQSTLLNSCKSAIKELCYYTENLDCIVVVGAPISILNKLYDCAVVLTKGKIAGIVPKTYLSDCRCFSSADSLPIKEINSNCFGLDEYSIPVGNNLVFDIPDTIKFSIEVGEDLSSPIPPSTFSAMNGAELILNPSAFYETVNKRAYKASVIITNSRICTVFSRFIGINNRLCLYGTFFYC